MEIIIDFPYFFFFINRAIFWEYRRYYSKIQKIVLSFSPCETCLNLVRVSVGI